MGSRDRVQKRVPRELLDLPLRNSSSSVIVPWQFRANFMQAHDAEQRYYRSGNHAALDAAIAAWERILRHPAFPMSQRRFQLAAMTSAGGVCLNRYRVAGHLNDINRAVELYQTVLERASPESAELPAYLNNLAIGLSTRYMHTDSLVDLEDAITLYQQGAAHLPPNSPDLPGYLTNLGTDLLARYDSTGQLSDLEEAIRVYQAAVLHAPPHSLHLPHYLGGLGTGLHTRYHRTGQSADLDEAIRLFQEAVRCAPPDSPELPGYLAILGSGLHTRYYRTGLLADLDESIRVYLQAVDRTPLGSPSLHGYISNLGTSLLTRYHRHGQLTDLNEAIRLCRAAVLRAPPHTPHLPDYLRNLGDALRARYVRTGQSADLDEALQVFQGAMWSAPHDSPNLPSILISMGSGLSARYHRTGKLFDLDEAIRLFRAAVVSTPPDSSNLPSILSSLGSGLSARYHRTGQLSDLDEAIRLFRAAVVSTAPDSPNLPSIFSSPGGGRYIRYGHTDQLTGIEEAIRNFQTAAVYTPTYSPDLPGHLNNLGNGLRDRYACTGRLEDLEEARATYGRACQLGIEVWPGAAIVSSRSWGNWALERNAWDESAVAYAFGHKAMDQMFDIQSNRAGKESWLKEAQGLPANAAYALTKLDHLEEAVATLEAGRARLLAEALEQNRRDLERLCDLGRVDLLVRYRTAVDHIVTLQAQAGQPLREHVGPLAPPRNYEALAKEMAAARAERDAAVAAIRQIAGYEDFFQPPSFDVIQRATAPGAPLVYLITTVAGSLALVVQAAQDMAERAEAQSVVPVWLDGCTSADLDTLLVHQAGDEVAGGYLPGQLFRSDWLQASLGEALPMLGERLMGPLAERLHALGASQITLVADGRLALLPLHAARYQRDGQDLAFLDEFAVSYTPTARAASQAQAAVREHKGDGSCLAGAGNPLPSLAELGVLREELRAAVQMLARDNPGLNACQEMDRALTQPLETLMHQGRALLGLALRIREAAGPPADALVSLALRWPASLAHARSELESLVDLLPAGASRPLYEQEAQRATLLETLPGATLVHLSCHGAFRPDDPLASGLLLADGELTLRDIMASDFTALDAARLVVLSACQTAITDFRTLPDEAIGLPAGLIQAGVPAVVGTLWSVNDASTALLMVRFYELLLQDGLPIPEALRQAQRWLRDVTNAGLEAYLTRHETLARARRQEGERMALPAIQALLSQVLFADPAACPYADPYHWAPFVFYGAAEAHP